MGRTLKVWERRQLSVLPLPHRTAIPPRGETAIPVHCVYSVNNCKLNFLLVSISRFTSLQNATTWGKLDTVQGGHSVLLHMLKVSTQTIILIRYSFYFVRWIDSTHYLCVQEFPPRKRPWARCSQRCRRVLSPNWGRSNTQSVRSASGAATWIPSPAALATTARQETYVVSRNRVHLYVVDVYVL